MWEQGDLVRPNPHHTRTVNKEMQEWLDKNQGRAYKVERTFENVVKLYKVDFWVTEDLLLG